MDKMIYYLLLGGNSGDRLSLIFQAQKMIAQEVGSVVAESRVYETEPWGFECESGFLNKAVAVKANLLPEQVLHLCQSIEDRLGRVRRAGCRYSSRTMDIDIIMADSLVVETETLIIPHPRMQDRRFVLTPLNEIAGTLIHPKIGKPISLLLESCTDSGAVEVFL